MNFNPPNIWGNKSINENKIDKARISEIKAEAKKGKKVELTLDENTYLLEKCNDNDIAVSDCDPEQTCSVRVGNKRQVFHSYCDSPYNKIGYILHKWAKDHGAKYIAPYDSFLLYKINLNDPAWNKIGKYQLYKDKKSGEIYIVDSVYEDDFWQSVDNTQMKKIR